MKIYKQKFSILASYVMLFFIGATISNVFFYLRFKEVNDKYSKQCSNEVVEIQETKERVVKVDLTKYDNIDVLVNKYEEIEDEYVPKDLRTVKIDFSFKGEDEQKKIRSEAADNLEKLVKDAKSKGLTLIGVSGYRSYETQSVFYNSSVEKQGSDHAEKFSAKAGSSEHQTGLAMDLSCKAVNNKLVEKFDKTKEGIWLKDNCYKYGFIIRYPKGKEQITGYSYEPWHIRYVGKELAKYINDNKLTLEEAKKSKLIEKETIDQRK